MKLKKHLFIEKKFHKIINGHAQYDILTMCGMKGFLYITEKLKEVTCKNCLTRIEIQLEKQKNEYENRPRVIQQKKNNDMYNQQKKDTEMSEAELFRKMDIF